MEEAQRIHRTTKQMEVALEDVKPDASHRLEEEPFKATYPLNRCVEGLKQRYNDIAQTHQERLEQVKSQITDIDVRSEQLTICRACSSPGIILFTPRIQLCTNTITTEFRRRIHLTFIRSITQLCHIYRSGVLARIRRVSKAAGKCQSDRRRCRQSVGRVGHAASTD